MSFEILHNPEFGLLKMQLDQGQQICAEPSAMATMDSTIELKAGFKGGLLSSVGRALGGEHMIVNTFTAKRGPGEVTFAPGPLGAVQHYALKGNTLLLERGAYVASSTSIEVTGKWQGVKGFFSGEGMILLRATGTGDLFFNTYGAMIEIDVKGDYYVDTGYVVAFEDTLGYKVTTLPGLSFGSRAKTFFLGGEGLVCKFSGQGKLWIQTRAIPPFIRWIHPYRPRKKSKS